MSAERIMGSFVQFVLWDDGIPSHELDCLLCSTSILFVNELFVDVRY